MKPTTFDILKQISIKTTDHEYSKKIVSGYMLTKWLSHDSSILNIVNDMNRIQFVSNVPDDLVYKYYFDIVPRRRRFLKWTKADPIDKKRLKEIKTLMKDENISKREAEQIYSNLMSIDK